MRRCRPLFSGLFSKKRIPKDFRKVMFQTPSGRMGETVFANTTLLSLLKEREFIQTGRYDFDLPEFLLGTQKAYYAIAHGFAATPSDWSTLEKLLPSSLMQDVKGHLSENGRNDDCIPSPADKVLQKITSVQWSTDPPVPFPHLHPFKSIFHLITAVIFAPQSAKDQWTAYLESCTEWYKTNQLMVDVLFLVLAEGTAKRDLDIEKTHLWTFCRDADGEWNIVDMDH